MPKMLSREEMEKRLRECQAMMREAGRAGSGGLGALAGYAAAEEAWYQARMYEQAYRSGHKADNELLHAIQERNDARALVAALVLGSDEQTVRQAKALAARYVQVPVMEDLLRRAGDMLDLRCNQGGTWYTRALKREEWVRDTLAVLQDVFPPPSGEGGNVLNCTTRGAAFPEGFFGAAVRHDPPPSGEEPAPIPPCTTCGGEGKIHPPGVPCPACDPPLVFPEGLLRTCLDARVPPGCVGLLDESGNMATLWLAPDEKRCTVAVHPGMARDAAEQAKKPAGK
jgi:hypothetical protein